MNTVLKLQELFQSDEDLSSLLNDAIIAAVDYVTCVIKNEIEYKENLLHGFEEDEREYFEALDKTRRYYHDAAISSIEMVNRYCYNQNLPLLYTGKKDRVSIAEFCEEIFTEYSR